MRVLLDTSIIIAGDSEGELRPDLSGIAEFYVSVLTYEELLRGIYLADDLFTYKARARRLNRAQAKFGEGIPFDDCCLEMMGEVHDRIAQRRGDHKAHRFDRMIAATAMAHDLVLVTRNAKDFAIFERLLDVVER